MSRTTHRSPLSWRRTAAGSAILLIAAALSVGTASTSATAGPPKVTGFSIYASQTNVRTTTGKKLRLDVFASRESTSGITVTLGNASETHNWFFPVGKEQVTLNQAGKGRVVPTAAKVAPFAKMALTVKPAGALKTQRCQGQVVSKARKVKVAGTFWFDTRSGKRWGKVGSKTKKFAFKKVALATWTYRHTATECGGSSNFEPPCRTATTWAIYDRKVTLNGENRKVTGFRHQKLAKPAKAIRYDTRTELARSVTLTEDSEADRATLKVVGNGRGLKGSGTLVGTMKGTSPIDCRGGRMNSSYWSTTSFTNGSTPLQMSDIYGTYRLPNSPRSSSYFMQNKKIG